MCSNADAHLKGEKVMAKKLRCEVEREDYVKADGRGFGDVRLHVKVDGNEHDIFLTPSDAKKLRKQIKSALAEIEDKHEEDIAEEKEESAYTPHVGEVVEIYRNMTGHRFRIGEKVRIVKLEDDGGIKAESLNGSGVWWVATDIRPIQNWKPKEGEKVLIVDSTYIPCEGSESFVGKFGTVESIPSPISVYNEDESDWFNFNLSDLRPAE